MMWQCRVPRIPPRSRNDNLKDWDVIAVKGAPDVVLDLCTQYQDRNDEPRPIGREAPRRILAANDEMTKDALRVLGLAYRVDEDVPDNPENIKAEELEKDLVFVGLAGMIDPARPEVKPALEHAREAGIRTIMITGDYPNTARAIAETIGLLRHGRKVMTGAAAGRNRRRGAQECHRRYSRLCTCFARTQDAHRGRPAGQ